MFSGALCADGVWFWNTLEVSTEPSPVQGFSELEDLTHAPWLVELAKYATGRKEILIACEESWLWPEAWGGGRGVNLKA